MYSTIDGAKKFAKSLKQVADDSGLIFPLKKCQDITAVAGGYRDWFDLDRSIGTTPQPVQPDRFRQRLLEAVPGPLAPPVQSWLDREPAEEIIDLDVPRRWYRDVFPYLMASTKFHRAGTALIRPGSGSGQRLRADLVVGLLLNIHGGKRPYPLLEPDSLALVFKGDLKSLFRQDADHPRFEEELSTLTAARILDFDGRQMRVLPPAGMDLVEEVLRSRTSMAEHWAEDGLHDREAANAIRDALAAIGVSDALRVADAITEQGSKAYIQPSGAVLEILSDLAKRGEMAKFSRAVNLFSTIHPANAAVVLESVPAKISAQYLGGTLRLNMSNFMAWTAKRPDWADDLRKAVTSPGAFVHTVDLMAAEIAAA